MIVTRLVIWFVLAVAALAALSVAVFVIDRYANEGRAMKAILDTVFSDASIQPLAIADVKRGRRPPSYFRADADQSAARANAPALHLAGTSVDAVAEAVRDILVGDLAAQDRSRDDMLTFVDRTPLMRLPDGVHVWLDSPEPGVTRVAVFSRSVWAGAQDFGVNKRRVDYLSQELAKRFAPQ